MASVGALDRGACRLRVDRALPNRVAVLGPLPTASTLVDAGSYLPALVRVGVHAPTWAFAHRCAPASVLKERERTAEPSTK